MRRTQLSEHEVVALLVEHGLDDDESGEWIERYRRLGYLDDRRTAEQLVRIQHERRGRGSAFVRQELARRGIADDIAAEALAELDEEAEIEVASRIAERRAGQLRGLDRQTAERRLSAFLQRRGYSGSVVRQAVQAALDADR
nr:regulatory protein RecX [Agromyces seonyuensis]